MALMEGGGRGVTPGIPGFEDQPDAGAIDNLLNEEAPEHFRTMRIE